MLTPSSFCAASRLTFTLLVITMVAGFASTWTAAAFVQKVVIKEAETRFGHIANRVVEDVQRRVNLPVYGLKGARGVYAASERVNRGELAAYVASRDLKNEFPGALGFGFIERVPRESLDAFIAAAREENIPDFTVKTSGDAPDLYVIKYIYPSEPNLPSRGSVIGSEP